MTPPLWQHLLVGGVAVAPLLLVEVTETLLCGGTHVCHRASVPHGWMISLVVEVPQCR